MWPALTVKALLQQHCQRATCCTAQHCFRFAANTPLTLIGCNNITSQPSWPGLQAISWAEGMHPMSARIRKQECVFPARLAVEHLACFTDTTQGSTQEPRQGDRVGWRQPPLPPKSRQDRSQYLLEASREAITPAKSPITAALERVLEQEAAAFECYVPKDDKSAVSAAHSAPEGQPAGQGCFAASVRRGPRSAPG